MRAVTGRPTLWHIPVSHYSEKARWALAYKGIEHDRHAPPAGPHMLVALWLTRGGQVTLPVLELDGERIGDSTAIIAALERRFPAPPLYPEDPRERRAALELEAFYDEELGPAIRRLVFHELRSERDGYGDLAARTVGGALPGPLRRIGGAYGRAFTSVRFRVAGELYEYENLPKLKKAEKHDIDVVVDRLKVRPDVQQRLAESFEAALRLAEGRAVAVEMDGGKEHMFNAKFACPICH